MKVSLSLCQIFFIYFILFGKGKLEGRIPKAKPNIRCRKRRRKRGAQKNTAMSLDLKSSGVGNYQSSGVGNYQSKYRILLVGEGNFSFAVCLANAFGSAQNIVATSLDSQKKLLEKYSKAATNLSTLESLGCTIAHGVDAHTMNKHPLLRAKFFDRIVFNFPHAGFKHKEHEDAQIKLHQSLLKGFLKNSTKMLSEKGQVHVTHKTIWPYSKWEIVKLAQNSGLRLVNKFPFKKCDYPGYENKRGDGIRSDRTFEIGDSITFMFCLQV